MEAVQTFRCEGCGAALSLRASERTQVCVYCASPNVVAGALDATRQEPRFCIPHAQGEKLARQALADWKKKLGFFSHQGVRGARLENFKGVYAPGVLYSAIARARYDVSIGEEYYVTETYTTTENGKTVTRTRRVKKHEWVPLSGEYEAYATDLVVSASSGIPNEELEAIEPFDFRGLRRYSPGLVAGWTVETPSRSEGDCLGLARTELQGVVDRRLREFMPGDTFSDLRSTTRIEHESAAALLVPLWVLALKYDEQKPALRVLINGQTGKTSAKVPWSWPRLIAVAVIVLVVLAFGIAASLVQR
ncbi:MAG: hypothetical protein Q8N26_35975 [Myxococcales bacterium]|nr:hypothetical protein [Myxococcales bacterium]